MPEMERPLITKSMIDEVADAQGQKVSVHMVFRSMGYLHDVFTGELVAVDPFNSVSVMAAVPEAKEEKLTRLPFIGNDMAIKLITQGKKVLYQNPLFDHAIIVGVIERIQLRSFGKDVVENVLRR